MTLVAMFAVVPMNDSNKFTPDSYYNWSPEDGGIPRIILTGDVDSGHEDIPSLTFSFELRLSSLNNDRLEPGKVVFDSIDHDGEDLP